MEAFASDSKVEKRGEGALTMPRDAAADCPVAASGTWTGNLLRLVGRIARRLVLFFVDAFGLLTLFLALAVVSSIPGLQFIGLGYLLEAGGRVARSGRMGAGFIGLRAGARIGIRLLAVVIVLAPLYLVSSLRQSAIIIDPSPEVARNWTFVLGVMTALALGQLAIAISEGGRVHQILVPALRPRRIGQGLSWQGYARCRDQFWGLVSTFRLPFLFWLGVRGFFGGALWIAIPATLLTIPPQIRPINLLGFLLASFSCSMIPFLQTHLAAENRLAGIVEVRPVFERFRRAPLEFLLALVATLLLATPLYLIKIFQFPPDLAWLASFLFLISLYPARLLAGWAYARGGLDRPVRLFVFRWLAILLMLAASLAYSIMVFLTRYATWDGWWSLYEQHAFLIQVPLFWSHP